MGRIKVNRMLAATVAASTRALGLNMSHLAAAAKAGCNRLWRLENRKAIAAYADEVAREGLPLSQFRTF